MAKINVAVICGGQSGEHEVSVSSASSIIAALDPRKYDVMPVVVDKRGGWSVGTAMLPAASRKALARHAARRMPDSRRAPSSLALSRPGCIFPTGKKIDVAIPMIHGTGGEDGCLQGLLEMAGIPYVGSGVLGSAVGMDKAVQKKILEREGIGIVPWLDVRAGDWSTKRSEIICRAASRFGYPVFVKPANLGSSVGITKAHDREELLEGIREAFKFDDKVVLEKGVVNAREIECAVLGETESPRVSVCGEVVPSNEFYDYAAKYIDGESELRIPADLPVRVSTKIRGIAARAYTALEAHGLARADFFVTRGSRTEIFFNEINTLPGFTKFSMYPKLWEASGLPYSKLLDALISLALARHARRSRLVRDYRPSKA